MAKNKKVKFDVNHFKVGDRVIQPDAERYDPDMSIYCGTIQSVENDSVKVDWDSEYMNKYHSTIPNTNSLYLESEWAVRISILEEEFNEISKQVQAKAEAVKTALLDFQKTVNDSNYELFQLREAMAPLEEAVGRMGWSTSSLYC